jgi:glycosyltransferase involved in cell wall biosynthesis
MILIDSIYINKSGGKILLEYLIDFVCKKKITEDIFFLFDNRFYSEKIKKLNPKQFIFLKSGEINRFLFYKNHSKKYNSFICFANVPPPIRIKDKSVVIYFHNVLLLSASHSNLKLSTRFLLAIKKIYIKYLNKSSYRWAVQTECVSHQLIRELTVNGPRILICPIFSIDYFKNCNSQLQKNNLNYLYVADSSPQKNHFNLLDAWKLFVQNTGNENLTLHLTLDVNSSNEIIDKIDLLNKNGINVLNHGLCSKNQIKNLYKFCNYLIYPSLAESFGLPLIEAAAAGCNIIASNLPYVFEVVNPSLVFDPNNLNSILNSLNMSMKNKNISSTTLKVENKIDILFNSNLYV